MCNTYLHVFYVSIFKVYSRIQLCEWKKKAKLSYHEMQQFHPPVWPLFIKSLGSNLIGEHIT